MNSARKPRQRLRDIMIAAVVESMTRGAVRDAGGDKAYAVRRRWFDTTLGWAHDHPNMRPSTRSSMGETAETCRDTASRARSKTRSRSPAAKDESRGRNVRVRCRDRALRQLAADEHPRRKRRSPILPAQTGFQKNGTVTAATSSGVNDGAAGALAVHRRRGAKNGWQPRRAS